MKSKQLLNIGLDIFISTCFSLLIYCRIFAPNKIFMKQILLVLLFIPILISCSQVNQEYDVLFDKKGNKVVQLIRKDDKNKIAYLEPV